jgi:hypothetical protein
MAGQKTRTSLSAVFQGLIVSESLGSTQKMHEDDDHDSGASERVQRRRARGAQQLRLSTRVV